MSTLTNSDAPALLAEVTQLCEEFTRLCAELRSGRAALRDTLNNAIALCEKLRAERDDMTAGLVEAGEEVLLLRSERDKLRSALECVISALSQPVQTCEPSQRTAEVLLGDCTFAMQTARAALERPAP